MTGRTMPPRVKPPNYGEWWATNEKGEEWYEELHASRERIHEAFAEWVTRLRTSERISCVLEVGCGRAVRYANLFSDCRYVGYDISPKEISWCRRQHTNPDHEFVCADFVEAALGERFDLVFSHAVVDHVYDVDRFVAALAGASRRWLYLSSYRGWFPELTEHVYRWHENDTCYYNDLSPGALTRVLEDAGCTEVKAYPLATGRPDIPLETVVTARTA
jgi:SAM-dependent methyltransferase